MEETGVPAWLLGRLSPEEDNGLLSTQITTIVYGLFSQAPLPPTEFWFFLGKKCTENEEDYEKGRLPGQVLTNNELKSCRDDHIRIEYLSSFTKKTKCALIVNGSSQRVLNGRYLQTGYRGGASMFRNVRGWVIFKYYLREIPELGISLDTCHNPSEVPLEKDHLTQKKEEALETLLSTEHNISRKKDKSLFAVLIRAGLRNITIDQSEQSLHNNDVLADCRVKLSVRALSMMLELEEESSHKSGDLSQAPINCVDESIVQKETKRLLINEEFAELRDHVHGEELGDSILAKAIKYQSTSSLMSEAQNMINAEITADILKAIEERESILSSCALESARIAQHQTNSSSIPIVSLPESFLDLLGSLRESTITLMESLGTWLRYARKQRDQQESLQDDQQRSYSVFLAIKSGTLYPASEPVESRAQRYRRAREPSQRQKDLLYVGVFKSKREAIDAFETAYSQIPLERRLNPDVALPDMRVGLRSCGKHCAVRCVTSSLLPHTL